MTSIINIYLIGVIYTCVTLGFMLLTYNREESVYNQLTFLHTKPKTSWLVYYILIWAFLIPYTVLQLCKLILYLTNLVITGSIDMLKALYIEWIKSEN
jgi:hypothetical protein